MTAVVLAALAALAVACSDDGERSATPVAPTPCPSSEDLAPTRGRELPGGAESVQLCPVVTDDDPMFVLMPSTVLTDGVDQVVAAINGQPGIRQPRACAAIGGVPFSVVVRYADGSARRVTGDTGGCGTYAVGRSLRSGASTVLEETLRLMREQRTAAPAPDPPPEVRSRCDHVSGAVESTLGVEPDELVAADLCVAPLDDDEPTLRTALTQNELAVLVPALDGDGGGSCVESAPRVQLHGVNAEGDQVSLFAYECYQFTDRAVSDERALALLGDLAARAEPLPD